MITWSWWVSSQVRSRSSRAAGRGGREGRVQLQVQEAGGGQQAEGQQRQVVARGGELGLGNGRGAGRDQRPGLQERGQPGRGPQRELVQPGHPGGRLARAAHPAPLTQRDQDQHHAQGQLDDQRGGRWRGGRPGRLAAGDQDDRGDHHDQARQPAEDERQALPGPPLSAQDQDEGRDRKGLKGDREPDDQKINYHTARLPESALLAGLAAGRPGSGGFHRPCCAVIFPAATASTRAWWSRSFWSAYALAN